MTRSYLTYVIIATLLVIPTLVIMDAYGHGPGTSLFSRPVIVQNEQFSDDSVTTDQVITITGQVQNRKDTRIELSLSVYVTPVVVVELPDGSRFNDLQRYQYPLVLIYPPYKDHSTWYFRVEHNLPNPTILGPGENANYEMKLYPRKAGTYHVHTYFVEDYAAYIARGQTIEVTGEEVPTFEEIAQLYLPLSVGAGALTALALYGMRGVPAESVRERTIGICFAIKASYETTWLSGVSFWLVASSTYLYALERTYAMSIAMTAVLAAITFGGYMTALSTRRARQRLFGIGTSAATLIFYLALGNLRYTALGIPFAQFDQNGLVIMIAVFGNAVLLTVISVLAAKERGKDKEVISH